MKNIKKYKIKSGFVYFLNHGYEHDCMRIYFKKVGNRIYEKLEVKCDIVGEFHAIISVKDYDKWLIKNKNEKYVI